RTVGAAAAREVLCRDIAVTLPYALAADEAEIDRTKPTGFRRHDRLRACHGNPPGIAGKDVRWRDRFAQRPFYGEARRLCVAIDLDVRAVAHRHAAIARELSAPPQLRAVGDDPPRRDEGDADADFDMRLHRHIIAGARHGVGIAANVAE